MRGGGSKGEGEGTGGSRGALGTSIINEASTVNVQDRELQVINKSTRDS